PPPTSTLFPYTTLFRSFLTRPHRRLVNGEMLILRHRAPGDGREETGPPGGARPLDPQSNDQIPQMTQSSVLIGIHASAHTPVKVDRKSTRLNSSHVSIS